MPRERYSKLPVSTIRDLNLESLGGRQAPATRDPRFDNLSGKINDGLFRESYAFVKDLRAERISTLQSYVSQAKSTTDKKRLREMLGAEKDAMHKAEQRGKDKEILKGVKQENRERAARGLEPKYLKKRELKDLRHKEAFERLESSGKMKEFVERKQEELDRKRVKR